MEYYRIIFMKLGLFLLSCFSLFSYVNAVENIHLELGTLAGAGWQAEKVVVDLQWVESHQIAFHLKIATLILPALKKN